MRDDAQAQRRVQRAERVRAFIESDEYRQRFHGAPGGNQTGPQVAAVNGDGGESWTGELARAAPFVLDAMVRRLWLPN
jgi:hypothetical protein